MKIATVLLKLCLAQTAQGAAQAREGLSQLNATAASAQGNIKNIVLYIITAILALGLIGMVWAIINRKNNAKYLVIGWLTALMATILFIM